MTLPPHVWTAAGWFVALSIAALIGRVSAPAALSGLDQHPPAAMPAHAAGPTRMDGDVPAGYAHSRQGAVAAATAYATVLAGPLMLTPGRYRAAERVIAAPSAQERLSTEGENALAVLNDSTEAITAAHRGARVVIRYTPLAYRVVAYRADTATVSVWAVWLVAEQGLLPATETWSTRTLVLQWTGGDWKLGGSTAVPGPAPRLAQAPSGSSDLPSQLSDFEEYRYDL